MSEEQNRFGRLTFTGISEKRKGKIYWFCRCDCGNSKWIYRYDLLKNLTQSCGCLWREAIVKTHHKHGYRRHGHALPEYTAWFMMRQRCNNPNNKGYADYGGRGIRVCAQWENSFAEFLRHIGLKPHLKAVIDRIDNDGHYEPGNVRWATRTQSARNTRRNVFITVDGTTATLAEHCERFGISRRLVENRVYRNGKTHVEAFEIVRAKL